GGRAAIVRFVAGLGTVRVTVGAGARIAGVAGGGRAAAGDGAVAEHAVGARRAVGLWRVGRTGGVGSGAGFRRVARPWDGGSADGACVTGRVSTRAGAVAAVERADVAVVGTRRARGIRAGASIVRLVARLGTVGVTVGPGARIARV